MTQSDAQTPEGREKVMRWLRTMSFFATGITWFIAGVFFALLAVEMERGTPHWLNVALVLAVAGIAARSTWADANEHVHQSEANR